LIHQLFSSLERLRFAQDGSVASRTSKRERLSRQHSLRPKSALRTAQFCPDHPSLPLTTPPPRRPRSRLRKTQSTTASHLALQAGAEWFWSLPSKIQQTHFSREEQVLFAGFRDSTILDAADEPLRRLRQQLDRRSDELSLPPASRGRGRIEMQPYTFESTSMDTTVNMNDGLFSGFRWDDDKDELDLSLDDYHAAIADTVDSGLSSGKWKPSFRRNLSVASIQFHRSPSSFRKPSFSGRPTSAQISISPSHSRRGSTFLGPRHRPHASLSSIDPSAKHYRDPEARLQLRVYLASPQKFDEALEFGFPSIEQTEKPLHPRPVTSPRLTEDTDRNFFKDDSETLRDDGTCPKDEASVADSDSPHTPQDPAFQHFSPSDADSGEKPASTRPLISRKMSESHTHAYAARREMTLHMTLTRPDLRTTDGAVIPAVDEPLHITALPSPGEQQSIWDTLPAESSIVKRFWRRIRKS
jgi:hypothetical protein